MIRKIWVGFWGHLFVLAGSKLFKYIDMWTPNEGVQAVLFTNNIEYMKKVKEIK